MGVMTWNASCNGPTRTLGAMLLLLSACPSDGPPADPSGSSSGGASSEGTTLEPAGSTTADSTTGASADETGTSTGDPEPSVCEELDLPQAPLLPGEGTGWGQVAGEFAVQTTFGPWSLAEGFSGCDSYVFFHDIGDGDSTALRNTMNEELFLRSPPNVHFFFLTSDGDPAEGAAAWESVVGGALFPLSEEQQLHWSERVHFVTDDPLLVEGSVGELVAAHPDSPVFAIDRAQTWDDPGFLSVGPGGAAVAYMQGYTARYYNFRYDQDQWLASLEATEVPIIDAVEFAPDCVPGDRCFDVQNGPFSNSNNWQVWPTELPDAATMAGFDTMDLVVTATCGPDGYSDCGHWDYEAVVQLCSDELCEGPVSELARWITPYSRPGRRRWVIDATPMLGLLTEGGTQHFRFGMIWNMNPSVWDLRLVLRNEGRGEAPVELVPAFTGNRGFDDAYNDAWAPLELTPPADATRVELVAIISGHGQDEGNCAEWCSHQHEFTVNGSDVHLREFPGQVTEMRCAEAVDEGVVPGQRGNWTPGRAGWCPGSPVQPWRVDITDQVTLGAPNTLEYRGLYGGMPVTGNRGRIRLSSYIAIHR